MPKCVKLCNELLSNDTNVVIDNTNGTVKARKEFIDLANKHNARCVAIHINTTMTQSME